MPAASYKPLAANERHLKGLGALATTEAAGIEASTLLDAELQAKNKIDAWLLALCGAARGKAIIDEFVAADADEIDPLIADLADLRASSIVWGWYEARNHANVPFGERPRPSEADRLLKMAIDLAASIERSGKTLDSTGAVRRLRYSKWEQGPAVDGPMSRGSLFDDKGYTTDSQGNTRFIPHRHPLDEGGY